MLNFYNGQQPGKKKKAIGIKIKPNELSGSTSNQNKVTVSERMAGGRWTRRVTSLGDSGDLRGVGFSPPSE